MYIYIYIHIQEHWREWRYNATEHETNNHTFENGKLIHSTFKPCCTLSRQCNLQHIMQLTCNATMNETNNQIIVSGRLIHHTCAVLCILFQKGRWQGQGRWRGPECWRWQVQWCCAGRWSECVRGRWQGCYRCPGRWHLGFDVTLIMPWETVRRTWSWHGNFRMFLIMSIIHFKWQMQCILVRRHRERVLWQPVSVID
jgi:hypothetical protein